MRALVLSLLLLLLALTPAAAEPRVALVIGNSAYGGDLPRLTNPANDALLMADTLKHLGFKVVMVHDADLAQMKRAISDFGGLLANAGPTAVGLFFYAGHGLQISGENYLIPINARIQRAADADLEAVDANLILKQMAFAGNALNIIILDACRNNPLSRGMRSAGGGLARMDAPMGTFIAYSTAPGETAADGAGRDSPYTLALTKAMMKPGIPIEEAFRDARVDVLAATNQQQIPWESSSLTGAFVFNPGAQTASAAMAPAALAPAPAPSSASPTQPATRTPTPGGGCDKNCPEMVAIPAGSFKMGSPNTETDRFDNEGPQKTIHVKAFSIGRYDVTVAQFGTFIKATGYQPTARCDTQGNNQMSSDSWDNPTFTQGDREPVVCVSWDDAEAYVQWLAQATGKPYRLPSESEWEYAARAGETGAHYWGNGMDGACSYANIADATVKQSHPNWTTASCDDRFRDTSPVGSFKPNKFGLSDMLGDVKQWVDGCGTDSVRDIPSDGSPVGGSCDFREVRGSAWNATPNIVRLAYREKARSSYAAYNYGFRVALGR